MDQPAGEEPDGSEELRGRLLRGSRGLFKKEGP